MDIARHKALASATLVHQKSQRKSLPPGWYTGEPRMTTPLPGRKGTWRVDEREGCSLPGREAPGPHVTHFDLFRLSPMEAKFASRRRRAFSTAPVGPKSMPSSAYQWFNQRSGSWDTKSWIPRAKRRVPKLHPCWTPLVLEMRRPSVPRTSNGSGAPYKVLSQGSR